MTKHLIHPTAIIEEGAQIGPNVTIEPYAFIGPHVILEEGVVIKSHAHLEGNTTIGEGSCIYPYACIGMRSQDLKFKGEKTYVRIGKRCQIREFVTINSSTMEENAVVVGDDCYIMAYCHIAHNCTVGNCVIMGNNATLAGHCTVEDFAIIGGLSAYHQFTRIGCYAMVGGMSRVPQDVPPYLIGAGIPFKLGGINRVGLKRRGFNLDVRIALTRAFKILYRSHLHLEEALERIEKELEPIPEILHFLDFCRGTKRGIIGLKGITRGVKSDLDFDRMMENCVSLRGP